ncbi:hypothetical protein PHAVU_008G158400 [Phaseolus vulgaris]|uniref:Uncharacterized protein n=1 Tax=Phaseolus vulgaris TaxID=3885 RepID=V7B5Y6_PHAVU|nr:hypothetical protein PHAVU_008G158400g [Phaseolus vulgaris]ESW12990.1 hypothetical protein PHAVU_008G158400g [Phaseolus vulgaris]
MCSISTLFNPPFPISFILFPSLSSTQKPNLKTHSFQIPTATIANATMELRCRADRRRRVPIAVRRGSPARKNAWVTGKAKELRVSVTDTTADHMEGKLLLPNLLLLSQIIKILKYQLLNNK